MKPEEAKEYGLIDDTIQRHETADEIHELVQTELERDPMTVEKAAHTANGVADRRDLNILPAP
jgi:enoyl-CoA hydratase/carnithine racemase